MHVHGFDPHTPSLARIYDYLLGGKDHFAADRQVGGQLVKIYPQIGELVAENRQFLARAAAWAAQRGIRQFIDLGCGMPTEPNTHESVRAVSGRAQVAYVENDRVAISHLRACVEHGNEGVTVADNDARDVPAVLKAVSAAIDLSSPVCLIIGALLHFFTADEARALVGGYTAALVPGSCVVMSVGRGDGPRADAYFSAYSFSGAAPAYNHPAEEIATFLGPLPLVPPGLAEARQWHPDAPERRSVPIRKIQLIAGVARVTR
jgi:O-methyltransferase involved in polyketide biosynthesis